MNPHRRRTRCGRPGRGFSPNTVPAPPAILSCSSRPPDRSRLKCLTPDGRYRRMFLEPLPHRAAIGGPRTSPSSSPRDPIPKSPADRPDRDPSLGIGGGMASGTDPTSEYPLPEGPSLQKWPSGPLDPEPTPESSDSETLGSMGRNSAARGYHGRSRTPSPRMP